MTISACIELNLLRFFLILLCNQYSYNFLKTLQALCFTKVKAHTVISLNLKIVQ